MSADTIVGNLIVKISAEAAGYHKQAAKVMDVAKSVSDSVTRMVDTVQAQVGKIPATIERNIVQPLQKASVQAAKTATDVEASSKRLAAAMAEYNSSFDPTAGFGAELASMKKALGGLEAAEAAKTAASIGKLATASRAVTTATSSAAGALEHLAPFIGIIDADAGLAAVGLSKFATAMPEVAAAAAVFTTAVVGTTYVLHGQEAAANSLNDTLELGKYILAGATGGFVDYTEAATMAAKATKDAANQARNNNEQLAFAINTRNQLREQLESTIRAHGPFTEQDKDKFIEHHVGSLQKYGTNAKLVNQDRARAGSLIDSVNNADIITKLQKQIELQTKSREELVIEQLTRNHATEAQKQQVKELFAIEEQQKAASVAKKVAEHEAAIAAREAAHAAKIAADEQARAQEHVLAEGKRLTESLRTEQEKHADEIKHINQLYKEGAIDAETMQRAVAKINQVKEEHEKHIRPEHLGQHSLLAGLTPGSAAGALALANQQFAIPAVAKAVSPPKAVVNAMTPEELALDRQMKIYGYKGGLRAYQAKQDAMFEQEGRDSAFALSPQRKVDAEWNRIASDSARELSTGPLNPPAQRTETDLAKTMSTLNQTMLANNDLLKDADSVTIEPAGF